MSEFDFDFEGEDFDRPQGGQVAIGSYCFQVTAITLHSDSTGDFVLESEVLSGVPGTEAGKKHYEYFKYAESKPDWSNRSDPSTVRMRIFEQMFLALKLATPEEMKVRGWKPNFDLAVGRLFCGKIKHETYTSASGDEKT